MKGGLGGLLAGGAAGSILSGGLGDLLNQFQQKGLGDHGQFLGQQRPQQGRSRRAISPTRSAPTRSTIYPPQSGLSRDELLAGLSQYLPDAINHLTPDGRLPNEDELSGRI